MKTSNANYLERRSEIENYFDRTAAQAWERLTSTAPVGRIRASVRAGRDQMRDTLLGWLPADMRGLRLLDAGCGTGALAMEAMQRGAEVVAIDLSPTLVQLARDRSTTLAPNGSGGSVQFLSGDMLDDALGHFDHVVAMDSLIHYDTPDITQALQRLSQRTRSSMLFTFAPRTPLLAAMHSVGRWFPRTDRSPALTPVSQSVLRLGLLRGIGSDGWSERRCERVASGFYTSQAWEWTR
ncbi:magnesium protoporphyrin IX methyltransferase [Hydrogenophaga sp.]|uniref:magnesium protoporphyrin IX methyltransferase n=1 Tax=Hydrogenophaga sp. TaxID=1904254 RepID=UPI0025BE64E6|nr:magnesium protoporphyrin IX methyltransferase [Hydrogenophaga sp.]